MAECVIDRIQVSQMHRAARIIQKEGLKGIHTAVEFVGPEAAIGLLMMHLRMSFESAIIFEIPSDLDEQVNRLLRDEKILR